MSLGGGSFTTQNKVLPGAYINFVSAASANAELSDRGTATMPLELDWGADNEIFTVTGEDFQKKSTEIFGYDYTHEKMKGLRDLFRNINTLHAYRINSGGMKASNEFAEAKYSGTRGNDLKIIIQPNPDDAGKYDVQTILGAVTVDEQTVARASDLIENRYVRFKDTTLSTTASTPLTGGTNGTITGEAYQAYLDKAESYTFNAIGIVTTDEVVKTLLASFNRRMRDEMGVKFQAVLYDKAADYMGVVNVKNKIMDEGWPEASLVYWVTGIIAGCKVNKSNQNQVYDGEFTAAVDYTQSALAEAIKAGEFMLHKVNSDIRVLEDINSMVTTSDTEGDIFKDNQTIRVIDQLANEDAVLFNTKYLGVVPNDASGRISLWSDLVKIRLALQELGAIEDFVDTDVIVEPGSTKKSVTVASVVTIVNAMSKLYMTVTVE